jgi:hypothetical protein
MAKTENEPTTALAVIETPEQAIAAIKGEAVPEIEDPEVVSRQIMERILDSSTPEEVLGGMQAVHAQDVLTRPFILHGVRVLRSRFTEGPGVFTVLDAEFGDDGSRAAITCSSRNVMAQAVQLWRLDALPRKVVIRQSDQPTASGFNVLWMEAA